MITSVIMIMARCCAIL